MNTTNQVPPPHHQAPPQASAVHCQLMDAAHPGMVPMHKVNFDAKSEYDMIQNYKVLQDVFNKLKITKRYCDSVSGGGHHNYNPMERREACKGGKDVTKRTAPPQSGRGYNTTAPKSHASRRGEAQPPAHSTGPPSKAKPPSSTIDVSAYDQQITELKLTMDSLEKERDFYFAKLRDIEILCQSPNISNLPVIDAIQRILYAAEEDASIVEEAQAMLLKQGGDEYKMKSDSQKRKSIVNVDVDIAASATLSPRQRVSVDSDVHCSGSPLMTY
ncbi:hypothetical protein M8C21_033869 [Ambrosia artemisiifolia]|uniref:EB1 C-terminal domain-containing protein n=1 Tax=Ambrosia artemisiifolia TaxID=4212 RepID=A0AAD5CE45_AMBAR|nr:hypothetical protein M8C21_033869 [Ambrosia artemisiifolia]